MNDIITDFIISRWIIRRVFKRICPRNVYFAPRGTFNYAVSVCKEFGITTIELQHGIVLGKTILYTGSYEPRIDPDYFFVFGSANIGQQYGIPVERVINVGFPYKYYVKDMAHYTYDNSVALVVSEPYVTDRMINVLVEILKIFPNYIFHIRCHPQEILNQSQQELISHFPQIKVMDNTKESFCTIIEYQAVIGENSSVLFEAMSLHKKVGRINFGNLSIKQTEVLHGGTIINSPQEFDTFMKSDYSSENDSEEVYSDFVIQAFNLV